MSASNADDGINQKIDKLYKKIDKLKPDNNGGARGGLEPSRTCHAECRHKKRDGAR